MVSCLCVTTRSRTKFKEWLLWNYTKQDYADTELVVVSDEDDWPTWVKVIVANGNIPQKRNIALDVASGAYVTWFDDDDWQSPHKCSMIAERGNVSSTTSFFMDVRTKRIAPVHGSFPLFNSCGLESACLPRFNEKIDIASDTEWMIDVLDQRKITTISDLMHFWILHGQNHSNHRVFIDKHAPIANLDEETWLHVKKLEARLNSF